MPLSFYKMFGYPTGRRRACWRGERPWKSCAGPGSPAGTITVASVQGDKYYLAEAPPAFEDGTLDYLNIPAVEIGLKHIQSVGRDHPRARARAHRLAARQPVGNEARAAGCRLVRIYGPLTARSSVAGR